MLRNFTTIVLIFTKRLMMKAISMKKARDPNQFKIINNVLPERLKSKNDFNE